jgi:hypothetical protein
MKRSSLLPFAPKPLRYVATLSVAWLLALGAADLTHAQVATNEMWMRANALQTRERLDREVRQARADGVIKRWAPVGIEIPLKRVPQATGQEADAPDPRRNDEQGSESDMRIVGGAGRSTEFADGG